MLATSKQVNLAVKLEIRLRRLAPIHREARTAELSQLSMAELDQRIKALNQHTGFRASTTLSTPNQKKFLATLERELIGTVSRDIDRLTYAEADEMIQYYSALRKARNYGDPDPVFGEAHTPVVDIQTKKVV